MEKQVVGLHWLVDFSGCENIPLDPAVVELKLLEAAKLSGARILGSMVHEYPPRSPALESGVTAVVILGESHMAIETWPEHRYVSLDFCTCGSLQSDRAIHFLKDFFKAGHVETSEFQRGYLPL